MTLDRSLLPDGCPPLGGYYVYLTGGCNLACRHCWLAPTFQPNGGTGGHLDFDLLVQAIDEGTPLGVNYVKLTGGEPTLHPEIVRILDFLASRNISITIETNGTLLTPSLAQKMATSPVTHVSVSLDGACADTHDSFRGVKGSFEAACQGVRNLVEVGIHPQIIMSLHEDNLEEIEPLVRLAFKLQASSVKFNLIQPSGRGALMAQRGQVLTIERMIELGRWVERDLSKSVPFELHYSWPLAFFGLSRLQHVQSYTCSIFTMLGILSTGHLAMCGIGNLIPDLCYGKIGEDRVADVWTSHPVLHQLRADLPTRLEGICSECILRNRCLGTCVAENYNTGRTLTAPYWFCQMADEAGLFPPSRRLQVQPAESKASIT